MIALLAVARQLLADVLRLAIVALRPTRIVAAENLLLRRQLAMYVERGVKPRRPDRADLLQIRPRAKATCDSLSHSEARCAICRTSEA